MHRGGEGLLVSTSSEFAIVQLHNINVLSINISSRLPRGIRSRGRRQAGTQHHLSSHSLTVLGGLGGVAYCRRFQKAKYGVILLRFHQIFDSSRGRPDLLLRARILGLN